MTVNLPGSETAIQSDDTVPEVTARVTGISFISGDVQIRRTDSQEWERATLNLPRFVQGDELTTSGDSRLRFSSTVRRICACRTVRTSGINQLNYDGVALSLPHGLVSLRVQDFDGQGRCSRDQMHRARPWRFNARECTRSTPASPATAIQASRSPQGGEADLLGNVGLSAQEWRRYKDIAAILLANGRPATHLVSADELPTRGRWNV